MTAGRHRYFKMKLETGFLVPVAMMAALGGCDQSNNPGGPADPPIAARQVTSSVVSPWPLTISPVILSCFHDADGSTNTYVSTASGKEKYALQGVDVGAAGSLDIRSITRPNADLRRLQAYAAGMCAVTSK